ncbi:tyrosine-type recombinase/integrase [Brevundimonas sp. SL161]|uniref:tyrosine-type recombinase/integrase n=1 Tax=Brevundimonas sp. SL161 TaxID=2804613 RepID=UPI003CF3F6C3
MPTLLIDRTTVAALPVPERTTVYYDTKLPGFGLRVTASGVRTYIVEYRPGAGGRQTNKRRISIGRDSPAFRADAARKRATDELARVRLGADPGAARAERRRAATVSDVLDAYLSERIAVTRKASTHSIFEGHIRNWIRPELGTRIAVEVTRADVAKLHKKVGATKKVTANRIVALLHAAFAYASKHDLIPEDHRNPAHGVDRFTETGRERFLSSEEIGRLGDSMRLAETSGLPWSIDPTKKTRHVNTSVSATKVDPFALAAIRLLMLTGARLREILNLTWSEVDLERGALHLRDSKTGSKAILLGPAALEILRNLPRLGKHVIPGRGTPGETGNLVYLPRRDLKKPWAAITVHAGLPGLRIHDLRHSFASFGAASGLGLQVVGKLLGHANPSTTARYSHLADDPLRRASDAISGSIAAAMALQADVG